MNVAILLSILACLSSFYFSQSKDSHFSTTKSIDTLSSEHIDVASILERLANLAEKHQLKLIAFNPLFERGNQVFALRIEASFSHFNAWYIDALHKIPKMKWQHIRLKPKEQHVIVVLEGTYEI